MSIGDKLSAKLPHVSASTIARNPGLFGHSIAGTGLAPVAPEKKRLKQKRSKVSELEKAFGEMLQIQRVAHASIFDQFPLRIGKGSNYYLDFLHVYNHPDGTLLFCGYEVKGPYARSTGIVKLKAAASLYPWIKFYLVSRENGMWVYEHVLP